MFDNGKERMSEHSVKVGLITSSCIELLTVALLTLYILKKWLCYIKRLKAHIENESSFDSTKRTQKVDCDNNVNKKKTTLLTTVEESPEAGE